MKRTEKNWLDEAICKVCGGPLIFQASRRVDATRDGYPTGTCYRVCSKKCVKAYTEDT